MTWGPAADELQRAELCCNVLYNRIYEVNVYLVHRPNAASIVFIGVRTPFLI